MLHIFDVRHVSKEHHGEVDAMLLTCHTEVTVPDSYNNVLNAYCCIHALQKTCVTYLLQCGSRLSE